MIYTGVGKLATTPLPSGVRWHLSVMGRVLRSEDAGVLKADNEHIKSFKDKSRNWKCQVNDHRNTHAINNHHDNVAYYGQRQASKFAISHRQMQIKDGQSVQTSVC